MGKVGLGEGEGETAIVGDDHGAGRLLGLEEGDDLFGVVVHGGFGEAVAAEEVGCADGDPEAQEEEDCGLEAGVERLEDEGGGWGEEGDEEEGVAWSASEAGDGD